MHDPATPIEAAPLVQAWRAAADGGRTPFTIPGHKRRAGGLSPVLGRMLDADVPLFGGLDTVKLTSGVLAEAESAAADLWGADWARLSVGGSTHANQAVVLALGRPGDTVLVARTAHRSTLLGLVLAGLRPVWLPVRLDPRWGMPVGVDPAVAAAALDRHPEAVAVVAVEPSYLGTIGPVAELAAVAHRAGVPLVVDQAWGAHLGWGPGFPPHALAAGADALVTSAHKTLPAFSQAALVLARTDRLSAARLERAFDAGHTTSPAGAVLASADASRALLADPAGHELLGRLAGEVAGVRAELRAAGYDVPGPEDFGPGGFDPLKLVVRTGGLGVSGVAVERELLARGLPVEMADRDGIVPAVGLADDAGSLAVLVAALRDVARRAGASPRTPSDGAGATPWDQWAAEPPEAVLTPRAAFFADHESVPLQDAVGRVSAEVVAPYPPGVPVLVPGEPVTGAAIAALLAARAAGSRIAYAHDPQLATLQVVRDGAGTR
ncbi:aminotransferase class I/II-fold pyridoxal phosphate-dependent enzyme [Nakamurella endophytica]|uniref:aminotransferase class I/II-fold pyridoxal phosphate-dependent enzyme n=1 Tax=Nakamurella endophytica TaxID=1748367 RepID=UPI00166606E9|nr:aminotransferase class V-fold PLP-dependent enzyme [Nakamurella endophytica]